jgi:hypothetical protein
MRIWDAFISEGNFTSLQLYVLAALMERFKDEIVKLPYNELVVYLQSLPTNSFIKGNLLFSCRHSHLSLIFLEDVEGILSQAYVWRNQFHDAPDHLLTRLAS